MLVTYSKLANFSVVDTNYFLFNCGKQFQNGEVFAKEVENSKNYAGTEGVFPLQKVIRNCLINYLVKVG
jgi:hypothetical protein